MVSIDLPLPAAIIERDVPEIIMSIGLRFHERGMPIPQSGIVFYRYIMGGGVYGHAEYTDDVYTYITQGIPAYAAQYGYTEYSIIATAIR